MLFLFTSFIFAADQENQQTSSASDQTSYDYANFERDLTDSLEAMVGGDDKPLYSEPSNHGNEKDDK